LLWLLLTLSYRPLGDLIPDPRNARTHPKRQIEQLRAFPSKRSAYLVADVGMLWCGALGSFAVTASAIAHQHAATRAAIRAALERKAGVYQTPNGLMLPIAFKIGVGRKPG
jgi:hypothetical protein